ncbi:hypothetical protein EIP91_001561 [Steccherinum ochraceum]|uniref:Enoyl reductase (ER) domain-containing protein n=1 Tax=Steccherinum ochraceum TaxID=92696 RepID=A0A4R0RK71_9APHY|nr:hypothetical protein EIP91_001561 [Steccherinum ochraceum]
MSIVTNGRLLYVAHPTGYQIPGVHTKYVVEEQIDLDKVDLDGGILVKTLTLSSDPYVRLRMRDPKVPSTFPHLTLGHPVENYGVGVVVRSEKAEFKPGDHVYGFFGFENYTVYPGPPERHHIMQFIQKLDRDPDIPTSVYVGTLGMPGQTAYAGLNAFVAEKAKTSKTLFVSAAAGPVGTYVIEYARHTNPHLKIIASAGSPEKLEILKQSGADVVFNYKTTDTAKVLAEHGPIDIYWDHDGGPVLDETLANMQHYGVIMRVGTNSGYNTERTGLKNLHAMVEKSLSMFGFIVGLGDVQQKALVNFRPDTTKLVLDGVIKIREKKYEELKAAGQALADVHRGQSLGKPVVIVAED